MSLHLICSLGDEYQTAEFEKKLQAVFESGSIYPISEVSWFLSAKMTARQISELLELKDGEPFLVTSFSDYYGRAPIQIWAWLEMKLKR